jgi:PAS domain S-box-containing protein
MTERHAPDPEPGEPNLLFRLLVEQTPELLCLHALDGTFLFVNPASLPVLGYEPGELVGEDVYDLVHPEDRSELRRAHGAVLEGAEQTALTFRMRGRDGCFVWIETKAHPLRAVGEEITGVITSSRDVSKRMDLVERLEGGEAILRSVIASFDDLVFIFDGDGRFREYYQPRGRGNLFQPPEAFVGRHHSEIMPAAVSAPLASALASLAEGQEAAGFEYQLSLPTGIHHFEARLSPLIGTGGVVSGAVGVVREITHRRAEEEARMALFRAGVRAERLEALAYLAGGTAHQFNNLLTVIQGNLMMAQEETEGMEEAHLGIAAALEAVDRAAELTRRLLTSAGDFAGPLESVDIQDLVTGLGGDPLDGLKEGIRFEVDLPASVPRLRGNRARLLEAVRQVVANAGEAAGEGGAVVLRVGHGPYGAEALRENRIGPAPEDGDYVAIEVSDNGPGIDPEILPQIFGPFFTTRFIGRGLGLAEVAGTLRSHGGAVLVESQPGSGARFTLLIPAEPS